MVFPEQMLVLPIDPPGMPLTPLTFCEIAAVGAPPR
jgi:hypothetical protein